MPAMQWKEVQANLVRLKASLSSGECGTCECLLGYVAQLKIDSDPDCRDLFLPFQVDRNSIHRCLGCDPCPPGEMYAGHMRKKNGRGQPG